MANTNLHSAKRAKNDEFYTRLQDIEAELKHYRQFNAKDPAQNFNHFQDKVVLCNCDDPDWSNFWKYFTMNFEFLGLKKLISTHYEADGSASYAMILDRDPATGAVNDYGVNADGVVLGRRVELEGNGDFRSAECVAFLEESDIVVTNPPFSLFREYVAQLMAYTKQFILMANQNAITYKEIFPLIRNNQMWLGTVSNKTLTFSVPEHYHSKNEQRDNYGRKIVPVPAISWFTNLDHKKRHDNLPLFRYYEDDADMFLHYDNYDAINVDRVKDIPCDYEGVMGVPITFLDKYNPEQFEILGITKTWNDFAGLKTRIYPMQTQVGKNGAITKVGKLNDGASIKLNNKPSDKTYYLVNNECFMQMYARILIRNLHPTPKPAPGSITWTPIPPKAS